MMPVSLKHAFQSPVPDFGLEILYFFLFEKKNLYKFQTLHRWLGSARNSVTAPNAVCVEPGKSLSVYAQ